MDACLFALALWLSHKLREIAHLLLPERFEPILPFEFYVWLYLLIIPAAPLILDFQGFYTRPLLASRRTTYWALLKACSLVTVGVILYMFLEREQLARGVVVLFGGISFLVMLVKEELLLRWMRSGAGQSQTKKRVILVGTTEDTARLKAEIIERSQDGVAVAAELDLNKSPVEELAELLHEHSANGVILTAKHTFFGQIEKAIQVCELEGVEVWLMADFFKTQISQTTLDDFYGRPTLVFRSAPEASWQGMGKVVMDAVGAAVFLLLTAPFMIIFAITIKITSPGPVFFRQQRSGLNGRPFTMLKFRSMVTNAEQRKHELAALNEMSGPVFKVTNDPRVTKFGRFMRKFSIDEWPQMINVLRGEMSMVGPRPLPVDEVQRFDDLAHRRRLSVKPGLTCLWQVSGRNNVKDFRDWVRLDLEYIDNWSLWLDCKILIRTIPVVLLGTGAK